MRDPANPPEPESPATCPVCGAALPDDAPRADGDGGGHGAAACPACLLRAGFGTDGRPAASTPTVDEVAAKLPQFEVTGVLGRGGMGVVFAARQRTLDREVALKVLPAGAAGTAAAAPGFAERFRREAKALARLDHPNIVRVHESGEAEGLFWLAMERVEGTNLRQAMAAAAIRPREALAIVRQICDALEYAHEHGVVHRDIKPENVLISTDGRVKVADFGIAKIAGAAPDASLTAAGQTMGTPAYMAPEQIEHPSDVDHRADIYSLGVVFYELLTGELPLGRFAAPSERVRIDVRLDEIVLRTLAKEREARYQRAGEVRTEVDAVGDGEGEGSRGAAAGARVPAWTASWAATGFAVAVAAQSWNVGVATQSDVFAATLVAGAVAAIVLGARASARWAGGPWRERTTTNAAAWMVAGVGFAAVGAQIATSGRLARYAGLAYPIATAGLMTSLLSTTLIGPAAPDPSGRRRHPLAGRGIVCLGAAVALFAVGAIRASAGTGGWMWVWGSVFVGALAAAGWLACAAAVVAILRSRRKWAGLGLAVAGTLIPFVAPATVWLLDTPRSRPASRGGDGSPRASPAPGARTGSTAPSAGDIRVTPLWKQWAAVHSMVPLPVRGGPASVTAGDRAETGVALRKLWDKWEGTAKGCPGDLAPEAWLYAGPVGAAFVHQGEAGLPDDARTGAHGLPLLSADIRGCRPEELVPQGADLDAGGLTATIEALSPTESWEIRVIRVGDGWAFDDAPVKRRPR